MHDAIDVLVVMIEHEVTVALKNVNIEPLGCIQSAAIYYLVGGGDADRDARRERD